MLTDKFGIDINIGDIVVVSSGTRSLSVGTVLKMNKFVTIEVANGQYKHNVSKPSSCVIIINQQMIYNKEQYAELFI